MEYYPLPDVLNCALLASHVFLENGAETYRAEEGAERICKSFGAENAQIMALPTGAIATLSRKGEPSVTAFRRVTRRSFNLSAIDRANDACRKIESNEIKLAQAVEIFTELLNPSAAPRWHGLIGAAGSSGFFSLLFGGGCLDFAVATLCGLTVQAIAGVLKREDSFPFLVSLIGSMLIALSANLTAGIFPVANADAIIAGALMPLLPGLAMTNSIRDTMRGDLVSGVARAAEVVLVSASLAAGVGIVLGLKEFCERVL
ncbi:MAG: threonine/serine exporter family protein [Clostridiales bacterium]|jgi:uncharacterized membrane protein YjjP (DUF1212 family)|nr:threonine/serine exporter family protein [Clostridiales bacterium]